MSWLWIALVGGVVGLDSTSFPQIMISRPIVAGALTGLVLGHPVEGALVGLLLEVFHLSILPIGAARTPEAGTAAVAAAAAYLMGAPATPAAAGLLLALTFGLAWERVAGYSVVLERRTTERILHAGAVSGEAVEAIEQRHLTAMAVDLVRGALVGLAGAGAGSLLLRALGPLWALPRDVTLGMIGVCGAAVLAGSLVVFGGWTDRRKALLLGIACGSLALLLR
jgi:mannose/fructose/N-acetylgalactosamine-specific phosphotransferase system component IIC